MPCVGSHEPRKNHLALHHVAELLWRDGVRFTLTFVGGSSWGGAELMGASTSWPPPAARSKPSPSSTTRRCGRHTGSPASASSPPHEGFGLPVGESIAAGTPAITSDFGSMREIAEGGGTLMVDPREDRQLADARRTVLTDDRTHAGLAAECRGRASFGCGEYAGMLWDLAHGADSSRDAGVR